MNADPLMVMQNMHVIEGRPSWSSKWIIAWAPLKTQWEGSLKEGVAKNNM
jgi:hypothetical protein